MIQHGAGTRQSQATISRHVVWCVPTFPIRPPTRPGHPGSQRRATRPAGTSRRIRRPGPRACAVGRGVSARWQFRPRADRGCTTSLPARATFQPRGRRESAIRLRGSRSTAGAEQARGTGLHSGTSRVHHAMRATDRGGAEPRPISRRPSRLSCLGLAAARDGKHKSWHGRRGDPYCEAGTPRLQPSRRSHLAAMASCKIGHEPLRSPTKEISSLARRNRQLY